MTMSRNHQKRREWETVGRGWDLELLDALALLLKNSLRSLPAGLAFFDVEGAMVMMKV